MRNPRSRRLGRYIIIACLAIVCIGAAIHESQAQPPEAGIALAPEGGGVRGAARRLTLLFDFQFEEVRGFWCVVATFGILILVMVLNVKVSRNRIIVYRQYEQPLLDQDRLDLESMLKYHAQYHWGDYAAVAISAVLISVTLIVVEISKLTPQAAVIQSAAVLTMTIAAIMLCYADLVHTNTQTPIIPINRRFDLIDTSVQFGVFGTMLMLLSILFFVALISFAATLAACIFYIGILAYIYNRRRILKSEYFEYFDVNSVDGWKENDHEFIQHKKQDKQVYTGKIIPYRRASENDFAKYVELLGKVHGRPGSERLLNEVRRCLRLSEREHTLALDELKRKQDSWDSAMEAAKAGGLHPEIESLLSDIAKKIGK